MGRFTLLLIMAAALLFMVFGLNIGQTTAPPDPILDVAAATKVEQPLRPSAEVQRSEITYSQFETYFENGDVIGMIVTTHDSGPATVTARLKSGAIVTANLVGKDTLPDNIQSAVDAQDIPVDMTYQAPSAWGGIIGLLLPIGLILLVMMILPRIMRGGMGGGAGTGVGPAAKKVGKSVETPSVTLADIGGISHIKPQLDDMIDKILNKGNKGRLGGVVPKGFLFEGPPGTGKTLLARGIAGELSAKGMKVGFVSASGSDFVELYVGQGARRVRDLFAEARKHAPCIIFIDEIDAVGKKRSDGSSPSGGNDEREQTLNAILTEMDGFEGDAGIIVIAATNRSELLDSALTRPGRFDRKVSVPLPDRKGREEILQIHGKNLQKAAQTNAMRRQRMAAAAPANAVAGQTLGRRIAAGGARKEKALPQIFANDVDFGVIATETPMCSGAELAEILKRAAEIAERREADFISMGDIRNAFQSLRLGDEMPREMAFVDEFSTSVHEILGHAVVAGHNRQVLGPDHADDVQTVSITPRGNSLGAVWTAPTKDRVSQSQKYLKGRLQMAMAGQIAEKLYLGPDAVTSGASSDIKAATQIASGMVSEYAMSDSDELTFRNYMEQSGFTVNKAKAELVDHEIDQLLRDQYIRAEAIMFSFAQAKDADGNDLLEMLTRAMLVKKTLQGETFMRLLSGEVVFDRAELDLGAREQEFLALWNAQKQYRAQRLAVLKKDYAAIANEYSL